MKRYLSLAAIACLPMCGPHHHYTSPTHPLDGPTRTESIETGVPMSPNDYDGDGCDDPWQRVDADPLPNNSDYCIPHGSDTGP